MNSCARSRCWLALIGLVIGPGIAFGQAASDDVKSWLDRMNAAVESLNYRGTYVQVVDGNGETLQIVHRNDGGEVRERISSREGAGREILRTAHGVRSVFPEKRLVVVEEPHSSEKRSFTVPFILGDIPS